MAIKHLCVCSLKPQVFFLSAFLFPLVGLPWEKVPQTGYELIAEYASCINSWRHGRLWSVSGMFWTTEGDEDCTLDLALNPKYRGFFDLCWGRKKNSILAKNLPRCCTLTGLQVLTQSLLCWALCLTDVFFSWGEWSTQSLFRLFLTAHASLSCRWVGRNVQSSLSFTQHLHRLPRKLCMVLSPMSTQVYPPLNAGGSVLAATAPNHRVCAMGSVGGQPKLKSRLRRRCEREIKRAKAGFTTGQRFPGMWERMCGLFPATKAISPWKDFRDWCYLI